jgi:hypothetical protein
MTTGWWDDDDRLLTTLEEALTTARRVPPEFVDVGKAVHPGANLDAELAALIYDSERELAHTRTDTATIRALSFASPTVTIELEVQSDGLLGQIVPPGPAHIEVRILDGETTQVVTDELGCFVVRPCPRGPLRLRCRRESAAVDVVTVWVTVHEGTRS